MSAQINPIFANIFEVLRYPKKDDVPERVVDMSADEYMELHESRHSLGFDRSDPEFIDAHEEMWAESDDE